MLVCFRNLFHQLLMRQQAWRRLQTHLRLCGLAHSCTLQMASNQMKAKIHASTHVQMESNAAAVHAPIRKPRLLIHSAADTSRDGGAMLLEYQDRCVMARL